MTHRKGEITLPDIKRHWPHTRRAASRQRARRDETAKSFGACRDLVSRVAAVFSPPRRHRARGVLLCKPEDAAAFCEQFGGSACRRAAGV